MEKYFTTKSVVFVDENDFIDPKQIKYKMDRPLILMVGGSFCPNCTDTAPDFDQFAIKYKKRVICAVLQVDGSPEQQALGRQLTTAHGFNTVPMFLLYNKKGEFVKLQKERSEPDFLRLLKTNINHNKNAGK